MTVDELKERLEDEFQNIYKCILINGDWGIGKSYFLENDYLKGKDYIKISLFGLNNIEEVKSELYAQLDKFLDFIKNKILKKLSGNNINLFGGIASVSIPYFETDIKSAIKKKCKKENLIVVIDDLERKSTNINMEDILGIIESISTIENINIILVANEKKIYEDDRKIYENFKEKVIQKVYNVNKYSNSAPTEVIKKFMNNLELSDEKCKLIQNTILEVFKEHSINNLRTLEKGCYFVKLIIKHINLNEVNENEIKEIIIASSAVVIEQIEKLYISIEIEKKEKKNQNENSHKKIIETMIGEANNTLTYCIMKYYFKESFFVSNKNVLIDSILNIYRDIDVNENFNRINKFYKDLHTLKNKGDEKDTFYLSEEQLKNRIKEFYNNYVIKIDDSLDISNWFKKVNEFYHYSTIIGMQNIFEDAKIFNAMDLYLENTQIDNGLLNRHILYEIEDEKIKEYNKVLNKKIAEKYYYKCIEEITCDTKKGIYESTPIENLFTIFTENKIDIDKQSIMKKIKEYKYFIPNLNYEISENMWSFAHTIWEEARCYKEFRDKTFEESVKEILKVATPIGRYRIQSLNRQYGIILE